MDSEGSATGADLVVSVVLPCLNEVGSVGGVVRAALASLRAADLRGEVIVADNGSHDGSGEVARAAGARVVTAPQLGYGNAYHAGMAAAKGRILVMADADGTYPMSAIPRLLAPILEGSADLVIGSRLTGEIARNAMPWAHRYIGNPVLTRLLNRFAGIAVSDAHSGMRAIDADAYRSLVLRTPGMEYASEMIVQAARAKLRMREIPIEYHPRIGESKLQTWPDGWRHLKFLLLASPTWLYLIPGLVAFVLGSMLVVPLTFGEVQVGGLRLFLHPMILGAVLMIIGWQLLLFGVLVRACMPMPTGRRDRVAEFVHNHLTIDRTLLGGGGLFLTGVVVCIAIATKWASEGFGPLQEIRPAIAALVLVVLGTQTISGGFLYAFFLPTQYGGGVAPSRANTHQPIAVPEAFLTGVAVAGTPLSEEGVRSR